jgi:hypothetical protein
LLQALGGCCNGLNSTIGFGAIIIQHACTQVCLTVHSNFFAYSNVIFSFSLLSTSSLKASFVSRDFSIVFSVISSEILLASSKGIHIVRATSLKAALAAIVIYVQI